MLHENEHYRIRIANMTLKCLWHWTNLIHKTYKLLFQLVLLLCLLQYCVCLRKFGLQQLFLQVSVLEDLFQVLEDNQVNLWVVFTQKTVSFLAQGALAA